MIWLLFGVPAKWLVGKSGFYTGEVIGCENHLWGDP